MLSGWEKLAPSLRDLRDLGEEVGAERERRFPRALVRVLALRVLEAPRIGGRVVCGDVARVEGGDTDRVAVPRERWSRHQPGESAQSD